MANQFALNFLGVEWQVRLIDCLDKTDFDPTHITDQKMIFYKPDGTKLIKQAVLVSAPDNENVKYITYINTAPEVTSILDQVGKWEFAGMVKLVTNDSFESSQKSIFWVE